MNLYTCVIDQATCTEVFHSFNGTLCPSNGLYHMTYHICLHTFHNLKQEDFQFRESETELSSICGVFGVSICVCSYGEMAEASISEDHFMCSVCLDLLKDPVTVPCGHTYCMRCITDCWNQEDQTRIYSCPQCRQTFCPRPVLGKNVMFAEMMEKLKKTKVKCAVSDQCSSGAGDVECDVCTGRKHKAIKSCLLCLNSYCQTHLEQHENLFRGQRHNLIDATAPLHDMICPQHDKILEIYCRTDHKLICMLCMMAEHKNHETVLAAEEGTHKKRHLKETKRKLKKRIQKRQKDIQELRDVVESHKRCAQTAVEDCEMMFTELISSIERRRSEVTQLIRDQETAAVSSAEGLLERLKQEIDDLRRRDAELEKLLHTQHHIHLLQSLSSLSAPHGSTDSLSSITVSSLLSFDDVITSVSHLRDKLEHLCTRELEKISERVKHTEIIHSPELKTRDQFLQYSLQLTLDLNTVNKRLHLSENNREITHTYTQHQYPDHPDRFDDVCQVLCRESVCGRSYWEIEWNGVCVFISVSYKSIMRKGEGDECLFGCNDQSWSLFCGSSYSFSHNNIETDLSVKIRSNRIGVYVDERAGILSFFSVSDTMTLIHSISTTFTKPLYPGFRFSWFNSKVEVCDLTM
ncbi:tripartite motif-containing protein 16-like isoform X1 [Triplophysa dalaica]|uniref:tripartite motif-containing protein 16-like isoform X1 n=1 Tax=Triplophysa dalaica TaxID=1582913 RepID=UPI0024DFBC1A|nr:tripartite motif-containing protein 16-like isoform X1 [Triplophysa dalaica]